MGDRMIGGKKGKLTLFSIGALRQTSTLHDDGSKNSTRKGKALSSCQSGRVALMNLIDFALH